MSCFSVAPVPPATMSNTFTIEVPWVDSYSVSRPQMLSAATRAWRFAGPASGMIHDPGRTVCSTSTASPAAQMSGCEVRMCRSTLMPPRGPSSMPASTASWVFGRTPALMMTSDVLRNRPLVSSTVSCPALSVVNAAAAVLRCSAIPWARR